MHDVIDWFNAYKIDHKVEYTNGKPARVIPLGDLRIHKAGHNWFANGKVVSRKFVAALKKYYSC